MKFSSIAFIFFITIQTTVASQNTFERSYSTYDDDTFSDIVIMADSSIVYVGRQRTLADSSTHSFFIRTNRFGDTLWTRIIRDTLHENLQSAIQTSDHGIVAAGTINNDFYLIKLNGAGQVKWRKGIALAGIQNAMKVIQCNDKGYLMAGINQMLYTSGNYTGTTDNAYLVKTDSVGTVIWTKLFSAGIYTNNNTPIRNNILSVAELPSGDIVATGVTASGSMGGVMLCRLSSAGVMKWARMYSDPWNYGSGRHIVVAPNRDIYIAGEETYNRFLLMKTDSSGNPIWIKNYQMGDRPMSLQFTKDQNLIMCVEMFSSFRDIGLFKFNLSGDTIWAKIFGQPNIDFPKRAVEYPGGGFLVITDRAGSKGVYNLFAIKTNSLGHACFNELPKFKVDTPQIVVSPCSFTYSSGGTSYNVSSAVGGGATLQVHCSYNPPAVVTQVPEREHDEIKVFPNPVSTTINLYLSNSKMRRVDLISSLGEIILQRDLKENHIELDFTLLENGFYILRVNTTENKIIQQSIIISH